jgi:3'(2'), 5'-bisphosphate nucleotidase
MAMDDLLTVMEEAARTAGAAALDVRAEGVSAELKADRSPVTRADRQAEAIILNRLAAAFPDIPVVAEEAHSAGLVPERLGPRFFLVDPIDGTREFIAGRDEFTVNIALVEDGRPVAGVVFVPALDELYVGSPRGAFRSRGTHGAEPIEVRAQNAAPVALASRSHRTTATDDWLARHGIDTVLSVGSSLKFCRLAEGAADVYPCLGPTMEWDTAAGQAVLEAAGGRVTQPDGSPLTYAKRGRAGLPDFRNPAFVALAALSLPTTS